MPTDYKLTYFAFKGLAEPIRFLFKYGGIEFEDDRFTFEQWPEIKKNLTWGEVPLLTVNGKAFNQNVAIARFVAKKANLMGKDDLEDLEIDGVIDTINDLRVKIAAIFFDSDGSGKTAKKEVFLKETAPYYLQRLDKLVQENGGHLACKKLTWADLYFVAVMGVIDHFANADVFSKYENLQKLQCKVLAIPSIKSWVEARPATDF